MKLSDCILQAYERLSISPKLTDTPKLDAELLLMYAADIDRVVLYAEPERLLPEETVNQFFTFVERRALGEPIAYILGWRAFYDIELEVTSDTLVPRPETECLVEFILDNYDDATAYSILDIGTGSGAIILALAKHRPSWRCTAVDISVAALEVAKRNASLLGIDTVDFIQSDCFSALPNAIQFDLIVSNPPYVAPDAVELAHLAFEPKLALVSQDEGLACLKQILLEGRGFLTSNGEIVLEHGENQQKTLKKFAHEIGYHSIRLFNDYAEKPRFLCASYT